MTKERLEELIKQGATVWIDCPVNNEFEKVKLNNSYNANDFSLYNEYGFGYSLQWVFETKEQAEWHHRTRVERIERFEPPMWEDIDYYCFSFVQPNNDFVKFEVKKNEYIEIAENEYEELFYKSGEEATKENYEKACEIVRDLFRGTK